MWWGTSIQMKGRVRTGSKMGLTDESILRWMGGRGRGRDAVLGCRKVGIVV